MVHFHFLEKRVSVLFKTLSRNPRNYLTQKGKSGVRVGPDEIRRVAGVFTSQVFKHPSIIVSPGLEGETTVLQVAWHALVVGKHRPDRSWIVRLRIKPRGRQD